MKDKKKKKQGKRKEEKLEKQKKPKKADIEAGQIKKKKKKAAPEETRPARSCSDQNGERREHTDDAVQIGDAEASAVFRALGDDIRLQIMNLLEEKELCAAELLKSLSIVQSTLSHHMKILCESKAVTCRRQGRWSYYSINAEVMEQAGRYLRRYRK